MKSLKDFKVQVTEVLKKSTAPAEWIHDFVHSDNPKFAGKSPTKRKQMALAAYYAKKNEGAAVSQNSTAEVDMNESWSKTGKKGKHDASGEDSEEYQKVDKEGKPTGDRKWVTKSGKHINESKDTDHVINHDSEDVKASHNYVHKNAEAVAKRNNGNITRHSDTHTEISYPNGHTTHIKTSYKGDQAVSHIKHHYSESAGLDEDQYTSEYKIKSYVDPITGENKTRKIRPHRVDFKNSKMRGEPAQKDSKGDYGMKEEVQESRGHKVINTFLKNMETQKNVTSQTPEEKAEHEKKHREAMTKAHNEYVKKNPNSIFKPMKEETEQLDEISKAKLVRYIDKASQDVHNKALEAGKDSEKPGKATDFIKKYQKSGKRQAGITKAAVKLAREEVELEEDLDKDHIHQLLANKDINAQVKGGKVHVHSSDVKAAKMHLSVAGHKHEVVGGLNEDHEEDDRQGAEHHQKELEQQELEAKKKKEKVKEEVQIDELSKGTLSSYIKNATKDYGYARRYQDKNAKDIHGDDRDLKQVRSKRFVGISKAADKLAKEEANLDEGKRGLWDNIHAKRKRIASGSGERMRKPGSKGAPTADALKAAAESFDYNFDMLEEAVKSIDQGEYDYEGQMARTQLQTTLRNCQDLIDMIEDDENMPEWVQSKITLAQDYITTVRDYLQSKEELDEGKVYDPFTKKMVNTKPIKVQAGGGATRNGVPVETGPSKYKEKLKNEEVQIDELSKELVARYANKAAKTTQANYDKSKDKFQFSSGRQDGMKNAVKKLTKEEVQLAESVDYHEKMAAQHSNHSNAHESEVTNGGGSDHDYAAGDHADAEDAHRAAAAAHKKHGADSAEYKKAAEHAKEKTATAKETSQDAGRFRKVTKPASIKEDYTTLDEISGKTLKSYANKAFYSGLANREKGGSAEYTFQRKQHNAKADKRFKGVGLAIQKLGAVKEETLDELKKSTLASYVKKAHKSNALNANDLGHQTGSTPGSSMSGSYIKQKMKYLKRSDGIDKAVSKLAKEEVMDEATTYKGIGTDVVDKKKVLNPPISLTQKKKEVKDFKEGDTYDEKWKGYKGKSFKKESSMLKFGDFLKEAKKCMDESDCDYDKKIKKEELVGKQHKLDKNNNGKLDSDDFKKLRKEDTEQIDELSKGTLASYVPKAARSARIHGQISSEYKSASDRARKSSMKDSLDRLSKKYKNKAWSREDGIKRAADKLAKEEVQIDELSKGTLASYAKASTFDAAKQGNEIAKLGNNLSALSKVNGPLSKLNKRLAGHSKAVDKLAKEEVEQIDELSKKTLGSYVKKASRDMVNREVGINTALKDPSYPHNIIHKATDKQSKRKFGMDKAVDKLTKEEVEQEQSPYLKATLAVMDEGKIDNLKDAQALRKASSDSYNDKKDTNHPHIQVVKGTAYGGENQKDDDNDEKPETTEKRGRGRPSGSKSGAR